ncbi:hypothetical protein B0T11DRAFT_281591 [Plectosphaerella cucumerina]|uniref:Uncharacterized protein n=1 Tax=Plectosphaerella cucumerina TaxID=40658 RepID=A0A8K0X4W6_9PEZI|nr:hypothetical protein B0T11DRAFT_281591 [Plectosphaerella cucumerina]
MAATRLPLSARNFLFAASWAWQGIESFLVLSCIFAILTRPMESMPGYAQECCPFLLGTRHQTPGSVSLPRCLWHVGKRSELLLPGSVCCLWVLDKTLPVPNKTRQDKTRQTRDPRRD